MKVFLAVLAGAFFAAVPAAPALVSAVEVQASKTPSGGYTHDSQTATVAPGKTKLFFWKVKNPSGSGSDGNYVFDDAVTDAGSGYKVDWYKGKKPKASRKISNKVENAGYSFHVNPGKAKYFSARVKALSDANPLCLGGQAQDPEFPYSDSAYFIINGDCV